MSKRIWTVLTAVAGLSAAALPLRAEDFPADKLTSIAAHVDAGTIRAAGREGEKVSVSIENMKDPSACKVTTELKDRTLVLEIKSVGKGLGFFGASKCRADLVVQAPPALPVTARTGAGSIELEAMTGRASLSTGSGSIRLKGAGGELTLRTGSGSIEGDASSGSVEARTGSGSIRLEGLRGSVSAHTGSGSVDLRWLRAPAKGEVQVKTGSGSATLGFPEGTKLSADLHAGVGKVLNELGDDKDAALKVSARTGVGSITVQKAR